MNLWQWNSLLSHTMVMSVKSVAVKASPMSLDSEVEGTRNSSWWESPILVTWTRTTVGTCHNGRNYYNFNVAHLLDEHHFGHYREGI